MIFVSLSFALPSRCHAMTRLSAKNAGSLLSGPVGGVDDDGDYAKTCACELTLGLHTRAGRRDVLKTETRIKI
jgi:hypothetical protein